MVGSLVLIVLPSFLGRVVASVLGRNGANFGPSAEVCLVATRSVASFAASFPERVGSILGATLEVCLVPRVRLRVVASLVL